MGVPYVPPRPAVYDKVLPEGFYILRWAVNLISFYLSVISSPGNIIVIITFKQLCFCLYVCTYQVPGRAEADFGRFDAKTVVRNVYTLFSKSEIPIADENQEIMDLVAPDTPLPSWFTEEDLTTYGALYKKSGFRTALQVPYRCCSFL